MTLNSKTLAVFIVLILFGGILFSTAMGWWQTESSKVAAAFEEGEFAGQSNPADIRGSYTFGDVEKNFSVPTEVLAQAFGVQDQNPAAFTIKNLEDLYAGSTEIGTSSVRLFVAFYTGLPFDLAGEIYLPEGAAEALANRELSPERQSYLESHLVPGSDAEITQVPEAEATVGPEATNGT